MKTLVKNRNRKTEKVLKTLRKVKTKSMKA